MASAETGPFDAELCLRLAGERMVLDRDRPSAGQWDTPLDAAAHALVTLGMIAAEAAQAVVDDYHLALAWQEHETGDGSA